jgi:ABC-type lipoprotein export system ATPase subunit
MAKPLIKFENVSLTYSAGTSSQVIGAKDVSLEIYPEEYVIFFGPSGSGKSTLLYLAAGLIKPDSGNILVDEQNVPTLNEKQLIQYHRSTIGFIFQAFYLIPNLNIRDNILLPQIFRRSQGDERKRQIDMLGERFNINELMDKKPNELSGGQQQRVAAARALVNNPSIILADEPVGNLDTKNAEITMSLLDELNQKDKKTVILVTHDPRYLPYAHRVFYILDGQMVKETRNPRKQSIYYDSKKHSITELEKYAEMFPYLEESKLKAKLMVNQIFLPYTIDQQAHIESLAEKYLTKQITREELKAELDAPEKEGGVSMYKQSAQHLLEKFDAVITEMGAVGELSSDAKHLEDVEQIRNYLLEEYTGHLDTEQIALLDGLIFKRVQGDLTMEEFESLMDQPRDNGGVGMGSRTASNLSRRMELILMGKK